MQKSIKDIDAVKALIKDKNKTVSLEDRVTVLEKSVKDLQKKQGVIK